MSVSKSLDTELCNYLLMTACPETRARGFEVFLKKDTAVSELPDKKKQPMTTEIQAARTELSQASHGACGQDI